MLVSQHVAGLRPSIDRQRAIIARIQDLSPIMDVLTKELYAIEEDLFNSEGDSGRHGQWDEITAETRRRRKVKKDGPILDDTGALRASLTRPNALGSRRIISRNGLQIGSALKYADKQKQRRPIDFTLSQVNYMNLQVQRYVMGEIL